MPTEYWGEPSPFPSPEETALKSAREELIADLQEQSARAKAKLANLFTMNNDTMVGYAAFDEFYAADRAEKKFLADRAAETKRLEKVRKTQNRCLAVLLPVVLVSIALMAHSVWEGIGLLVVAAVVNLVIGVATGGMEYPRDLEKLTAMSLSSVERDMRGGARGDWTVVDYLAIGNAGLALLDRDGAPSFISYSEVKSVFPDDFARACCVKLPSNAIWLLPPHKTLAILEPRLDGIESTRASTHDTLADLIAVRIGASKAA